MRTYTPQLLSNAVAAIWPDIKSQADKAERPDNRHLWWELSTCILSSQVPYALAVAAADAIDAEELLLYDKNNLEGLMQRLVEVLTSPLIVEGRPRAYRFPVARARHLAATRAVITAERCSLRGLVDSFQGDIEARNWFVKHVPGIGPKQASMFLRNAGVSYDLAILDRHVLKYMSKLGIYSGSKFFISSLPQYLKHEAVLREYANELDCPVGLLDWAIWIVMRVAGRNMEPVTL